MQREKERVQSEREREREREKDRWRGRENEMGKEGEYEREIGMKRVLWMETEREKVRFLCSKTPKVMLRITQTRGQKKGDGVKP